MTTEAGGHTLNGEAFASGTEVEGNGSTYTLTLDGTWSAAYKPPPAMSLALGTTGGELMIERLEDGSYQANGVALASGDTVTAENGNMYTVTISDDGTPSEAYVVPAALSIPLGLSGDTVAIVKNEDGTYSVNGEVLTADTRVMAENGNVYGALLAPDGTPIGVMHIAAMQEVMLGELGGTITLTQGEDKAWWLGEMAVMDGDEYMAANGNTYTLTLDGMWSAAYTPPPAMSLALGTTGGELMIERLEDGSYQANGAALASGDTVTAENGNMYTVTISDDGTPSEEYVVPAALSIALGLSGDTAAIVKNEDGTYSVNGEVLTADTRVMAENGNVYGALLAPDGTPIGVMYIAAMQEVTLGELGGTITLKQGEDKAWWLGEMAVMDGDEYTAGNGNTYVLMMDEAGTWSGMYQKVEVMVALGTQGSITLGQAEDMSWWYGTEGVMIGSEVGSANGNTYTLWYTDGVWTARFEPEAMAITGTGLTAYTREAADAVYTVGGSDDTLTDGVGDVTADGAMYHVWAQDDGMLAGARFDSAIVKKLEVGPRDTDVAGSPLRTPADVALSANDGETVANETGTHVLIDGNAYSLATLLGGGTAAHREQTYIDEVRGEVDDLYQQVKTLADINAALDKADRSDFTRTYNRKWGTDAQKAVNKIFGPAVVDLGDLVTRAGKVDEETMLEDFEELLDALSSLEAFTDALDKDGLFEDGENALQDSDRTAAQVFDAREAETQVILEAEGSTRFGVFAQSGRNLALDKLEFKMDAADPDKDQGGIGAFAYSTAALVTRSAFLPSAGVARYTGGTTAVNAAKEPTFYTGQMDLQLSFATKRVTAKVSGLVDENGTPWTHTLRAVDSITLPRVDMGRSASFSESSDEASISYSGFALQPLTGQTASINGFLVGANDPTTPPSEAFGTWTLGQAKRDKDDYLAGAFGAQYQDTVEDTTPDTSGASLKAYVSQDEKDTQDDIDLFKKDDVLRFMKDPDDPDDRRYIEIALSALEAAADGKYSKVGMLKLEALYEEISDELRQLHAYIALDEADDPNTFNYIEARDIIWNNILEHLTMGGNKVFDRESMEQEDQGETPHLYTVQEGSIGRPEYDAELARRPNGSMDGTFTVPDGAKDGSTDLADDEVELEARARIGVLTPASDGMLKYPRRRGDDNKVLDDDAVQEIEGVLDALSSAANLKAALEEGGVFEGLREEIVSRSSSRTVYRDADYDDYADLTGELGDPDRERRIASQEVDPGGRTYGVNVRLLKTDYTNFGVAWGGGDDDRFAYSVLPQTRYPTGNPRFPARTEATYRGEMVMRRGGTAYRGDSEIVVTWGATVDTSRVTATFSDIRNWDNDDPYQLTYELVDAEGNKYLRNGRTVSEGVNNMYEYRDLSPADVSGGDADNEQLGTIAKNHAWDPRNRKAGVVGYDVEAVIFHNEIAVTNGGPQGGVSFGTTAIDATPTVDFIFKDKSLGVLTSNDDNAGIQGEFIGQDIDGPLAAMGIFNFTDQVGALVATPRMKGGADSTELLLDVDGMATFDVSPDSSPANPYTELNGQFVKGNFETVDSDRTGQRYTDVFVNAAIGMWMLMRTITLFLSLTDGIKAGSLVYGAFGTGP